MPLLSGNEPILGLNNFLDKFVEETTTGALMAKLFTTTMIPKERVPKYSQLF
jgi:hypothetical protein